MSYMLEFRDENEKMELVEKLHEAKKAVCEAIEAMEEADTMSERGTMYRGATRYRDGMSYRHGMRMRDDWDDMRPRRGRYSD